MNAITEGRHTHYNRLGLDFLVERHDFVSSRLDNGGTNWQSHLLNRLLLDPLIRNNGACVNLRFGEIADRFSDWELVDRAAFFPLDNQDRSCPADAVAGYAHYLHLCRLVCYSTDALDEGSWIFTNGASLRAAMGLPPRPSLHFND